MRIRRQHRARAACIVLAAWSVACSTAAAATYTFIPSASTTPIPAGTANWSLGANWVNASGNTTGTIPGVADVVGSATSATTIVNSLVPTINDLRWASAAIGTTAATLNGSVLPATGDATLQIDAGGTLNIRATSNGSSAGGALFGRATPSAGHLFVNGGTLSTGTTTTITNDATANLIIGDVASAAGGANSTFVINSGNANVGNNFIVGNAFASPNVRASGTVTQAGGTINVVGAVILGSNGTANYTMSGGVLNQLGTNAEGALLGRDAFFVGRNSNAIATFSQSGTASVSIANGLYIANNSSTNGTYTVSGGTLTIAGELKVGSSTSSNNNAVISNNIGAFNIIGNAATTITANRLVADTANSTLRFAISSDTGTTLLDVEPNGPYDGAAVLSASTKFDVDNNGFTPGANTMFELIRAASFSALPTIVADADAFDSYKVGLIDRGTSQSLVVAPFAVGSWKATTDNGWSNAANWAGGAPGAARDVATFSSSASAAAHQVHLDANETIGTLNFFDPSNSYTISGAATLTLDSGVAGTASSINVPYGLHTIAAPLALHSDLVVSTDVAFAQFTGSFTANGRNLTKTGQGEAIFNSVNGVGALIVSGGKLDVAPGATSNGTAGAGKIKSLAIAAGATLDLANNALVVDYTGAVGAQLSDLREHLRVGRLVGSSTDGLTFGYNDNAARAAVLTSVAGLSVDASSIILLRTIAGDTNLDRRVNFDDLIALAQNYNAANRVWAQGDFNYDGTVNFDDLIVLAQRYNTTAPAGAQLSAAFGASFAADFELARALVPEPLASTTMTVMALFTARRRPRT